MQAQSAIIRRMIAYHSDTAIDSKGNAAVLLRENGEEMMYYGPLEWQAWPNGSESNPVGVFQDKPVGADGFHFYPMNNGKPIRALTTWFLLTGEQELMHTVTLLSNFIRNKGENWFWRPHDPIPDGFGHFAGHIHGFLNGIMGLLWEAEARLKQDPNDGRAQDLMRFANGAYVFAKDYQHVDVLGNFGESCALGDMIRVALKLTDLGVANYYEDVDRWLRNQIAELQIKESHRLPSQAHEDDDFHRIGERVVGLFFENATHALAIPTPDYGPETEGINPSQLVVCGLGNPMMGIYDAWDHIVQFKGSTARVNLLLNRASCYLDIKSELPYRGRVDIVTKSSIGTLNALEVRIPDHTDTGEVRISMNGADLTGQWHWADGSYVQIPNLQANKTYTLSFPIVKTTMVIFQVKDQNQMWTESNLATSSSPFVNDLYYQGRFRSNTLVDVDRRPSGGIQLYQRQALADLGDQEVPAPTRSVKRFAPSPPRSVIQKYYFLRKGSELQKISLGSRPLGVIGWHQFGMIEPEWKLNGAFDFNDDRVPDIFGHNQIDGKLCVWYGDAQGNYVKGEPFGAIGSEWQLQVARFMRDGGVDIFGHNRGPDPNEVQKIRIWHLDGGKIISTSFRDYDKIGLEWELHLGDFDGDGILDILGVHKETGDLKVWFIKAAADGSLAVKGEDDKFGHIGREWQLQVADIDDDGYADIFGYNANNDLWVWNNQSDNDGRRYLDAGHGFGTLGTGWQHLQIAYLDGDWFPDLLGQSTSGALRGWYSNGHDLDPGSDVGLAPGWIPIAGGTHLR
jgi:hypothetical protein